MQIAYLEDDVLLSDVFKIGMTAAGVDTHIDHFVRSDDLIKYAEQHQAEVDLFVLDIRVPGTVDGMGAAKKIREMGFKGAILITSAYNKPAKSTLTDLDCIWMAKPWYIIDVARTLFDIVQERKKTLQSAAPPLVQEQKEIPPTQGELEKPPTPATTPISTPQPAVAAAPNQTPGEAQPPVAVVSDQPPGDPQTTPAPSASEPAPVVSATADQEKPDSVLPSELKPVTVTDQDKSESILH